MNIRAATAADADGIWRIFHAVVAKGDTYTFGADTPREHALAYFLGPAIASWVIEDAGGQVIGVYKLIPNHPGLGSHVANASFMVDPAAQGSGAGRAMGEHCLAQARQAGYEAMQFNFVVSTNTRAVALWQRLGFRIVATLPRVFRHATLGDVDAYVMHRSLDDLPVEAIPVFGERREGVRCAPRPSAYALVQNDTGLLALVSTPDGVFLPGGGIDAGEWAELTAVRETREECAIDIRTTWSVGRATDIVYAAADQTCVEKTSAFVAADLIGPVAQVPEHDVRWLPLDQAARSVTREGHAWAIRKWIARTQKLAAAGASRD